MMNYENLIRIYQDEMLAQAEQNRLISIAKRRPSSVNSYIAQIMAWLENLLCSWGSQLDVRSGKKTDSFQSGVTDQRLNV